MKPKTKRALLVADFNIENLAGYLRNDDQSPAVACEVAPYGQVAQTLLDPGQAVWKPDLDLVLVWTRPDHELPAMAALWQGANLDRDRLFREIDDYAGRLMSAKQRCRTVFVPTWVLPPRRPGHGMLDLDSGVGLARALMEANLRLLAALDGVSGVIPLNAARWVELAGEKAFNPRLWYLGKVPFGNDVFRAAAQDIKAALRGLDGKARKLVILDLDDTLWGGAVGEVGWQNLSLGGHDPAGEAFADFQRELKALSRRGVILAVASKNDEAVALEALRRHPEMILRPDDLAGWRINWRDKAENIVGLVASLNLGLDACVFIDNSPVERARVREALPQVLVPEWPDDPRFFPRALWSLDCFDQPTLSDEDRRRQQLYTTERKRTELRSRIGSIDDWLRTLDLRVTVEPLSQTNLGRSTQLLNKTNQMNLSTRRLTGEEFLAWAAAGRRRVWTFSVTDKFGDSGLNGILGLESGGDRVHIVDFLLSCRVMGRKIEEAMLHVAVAWARSVRAGRVEAAFVATPKNRPCHEFFAGSGFRQEKDDVFVWNTDREYPLHPAVSLVGDVEWAPGPQPEPGRVGNRTQPGRNLSRHP